MVLSPVVETLVKAATRSGIAVGAVSGLREETVTRMADKLQLRDIGVKVLSCHDEEKVFPSPDAWLALARALSARSSRCLALATSSVAARSALSAGMRVVALPDSFTSFQDFSGVDLLLDSPADVAPEEILAPILH